jgi:drug/metabolite transporter (DMT)-like permease
MNAKALLAALSTIILWSFVAVLSVTLSGLPPFFLTGAALFLGGIFSLPKARDWSWDWRYIGAGVGAMFLYHFLLFTALRIAPSVECNLINYLWPLFLVLLAPFFDKQLRWKLIHLLGGLLGLTGAIIAINPHYEIIASGFHVGYLMALVAALIWPLYSLYLKRFTLVSSWTMGLVCLISGLLSLGTSLVFRETIRFNTMDIFYLVLLGLGPLGVAFYLWNFTMKNADPQKVGTLSYIIPILSTVWLSLATGRILDMRLLLALFLVVGGAVLVRRQTGN